MAIVTTHTGKYTPSITNSVQRTLASKLEEVASVADFASIGDAIAQKASLLVPDGTYDIAEAPAGLNNAFLMGTPNVSMPTFPLPLFNPVFTGNRQVALLAGVVRYYSSGDNGAGWYFLKDQGEEHTPILLGPVSASGSNSIIIDINLGDFGIDTDLWTPAGVVVGPDETLARYGATFGASVGLTTMTIRGSWNVPISSYHEYSGSAWSTPNYSATWDGSNLLELTRLSAVRRRASGIVNGAIWPIVSPRIGAISDTADFFSVSIADVSESWIKLAFFNADGTRITTPDTRLRYFMQDPALINVPFLFNTEPPTDSNIWVVGAFTKK